MPFVAEKVTEMFLNVANKGENEEPDEPTNESGVEALAKEQEAIVAHTKQKTHILKSKIQFMSKVLKMQRVLREQSEQVLKIKAMNNNKLPQGLLLDGKDAIEAFTSFKKVDSKNERRPY